MQVTSTCGAIDDFCEFYSVAIVLYSPRYPHRVWHHFPHRRCLIQKSSLDGFYWESRDHHHCQRETVGQNWTQVWLPKLLLGNLECQKWETTMRQGLEGKKIIRAPPLLVLVDLGFKPKKFVFRNHFKRCLQCDWFWTELMSLQK